MNEECSLRCLGLTNSAAFHDCCNVQMAFGSYEVVGVIQRTPVPDLSGPQGGRLGELALSCVNIKCEHRPVAHETSHALAPARVCYGSQATRSPERFKRLAGSCRRNGAAACRVPARNRRHRLSALRHRGRGPAGDRNSCQWPVVSDDEEDNENDDAEEDDRDRGLLDASHLVADLLSYTLGCSFGRWDVRFAIGEKQALELPDPFAPLPVCSPGMLTGEDGLPLHKAPPNIPSPLIGTVSW